MKPWLTILALISMIGMGACSLIKYSNKTKDVPVYIHDTTIKYLPPQIDTQTVYHSDTSIITLASNLPIYHSDSSFHYVEGYDKIEVIHDTIEHYQINESSLQQAEDSATMWKGMYIEEVGDVYKLMQQRTDLIVSLICGSLFIIGLILAIFYLYKNKQNGTTRS